MTRGVSKTCTLETGRADPFQCVQGRLSAGKEQGRKCPRHFCDQGTGHVRGREAKWGSTEDQHQGKGPSVGPLPSGLQLCRALLMLQKSEGGGPLHMQSPTPGISPGAHSLFCPRENVPSLGLCPSPHPASSTASSCWQAHLVTGFAGTGPGARATWHYPHLVCSPRQPFKAVVLHSFCR